MLSVLNSLSLGCEFEMVLTHSVLHRTNGDSVAFRSSGNRDTEDLTMRIAAESAVVVENAVT